MAFLTRNKLPDDMLRLLRLRVRLRFFCLYFGLGSGVGLHGANKYDVETVCSFVCSLQYQFARRHELDHALTMSHAERAPYPNRDGARAGGGARARCLAAPANELHEPRCA